MPVPDCLQMHVAVSNDCCPPALLLSHGDGWLPCECRWRGKLEWATLNSAPSSDHDVARAMDSILSRSAPPTPNIQNWPTPSNQNWPTPSTSNMQKSKPSIGRRTSRAFARYSIVFLIGIGATLAWQSYGDEAMKMVRTEAPSLAWLLPVSTAKPPPDDQAPRRRLQVLLSWSGLNSVSSSCGAA